MYAINIFARRVLLHYCKKTAFYEFHIWLLAWGRGGKGPLDFEIFSKKGSFLSYEWEKTNFTTFSSSCKKFGKIP